MKRLSLTARLSLMFMLAVTGVLAAAGYFFSQLSEHHFDELDAIRCTKSSRQADACWGSWMICRISSACAHSCRRCSAATARCAASSSTGAVLSCFLNWALMKRSRRCLR
jgi:hypothetical protein